jgi:hypothetical protein
LGDTVGDGAGIAIIQCGSDGSLIDLRTDVCQFDYTIEQQGQQSGLKESQTYRDRTTIGISQAHDEEVDVAGRHASLSLSFFGVRSRCHDVMTEEVLDCAVMIFDEEICWRSMSGLSSMCQVCAFICFLLTTMMLVECSRNENSGVLIAR